MNQLRGKYNDISRELECIHDVRSESGRVLLFRLNSHLRRSKKELKHLVKSFVVWNLFGEEVNISTDQKGAPFLTGIDNMYVSLSHSGEYFAFFFSTNPHLGIDVEVKREINRTGLDYFLSEQELKRNWSSEELLVIWGVKETYLKINKGNLTNWKEAIKVEQIGHEQIRALSNDGVLIFNSIREDNYTLIYATLPL